MTDFSPDSWSPPERGPDESHRGQDALHPGVAVLARIWNHSLPRKVWLTNSQWISWATAHTFFFLFSLHCVDFRVERKKSWSESPTTVWSGWTPTLETPSRPGASATWSSGMSTGRSRWWGTQRKSMFPLKSIIWNYFLVGLGKIASC